MEDFYKTNDDTLGISATEFVNEWYNQQEYMFADIREPSEKADADSVKGTYQCQKYLTKLIMHLHI